MIKQTLQILIVTFLCALNIVDVIAQIPKARHLKVISPIANNRVTVYGEENTNIVVKPKQPVFVIRLPSNPSTGFSWFLREYDHSFVMPISHHYEKTDSKLIGTPGFELWTMRMRSQALTVPTQTVVRFSYARPSQGSDGSSQVAFKVSTLSR